MNTCYFDVTYCFERRDQCLWFFVFSIWRIIMSCLLTFVLSSWNQDWTLRNRVIFGKKKKDNRENISTQFCSDQTIDVYARYVTSVLSLTTVFIIEDYRSNVIYERVISYIQVIIVMSYALPWDFKSEIVLLMLDFYHVIQRVETESKRKKKIRVPTDSANADTTQD